MTPYEMGQRNALEKLGFALSPLMSAIGKGALMGGGAGALAGGIGGALKAPEGEGLSGFGRGALAGGLGGALLGGATRGIGAKFLPNNAALNTGMAAPLAAGGLGGAAAGVAAAPEEKPWHQKALSALGMG